MHRIEWSFLIGLGLGGLPAGALEGCASNCTGSSEDVIDCSSRSGLRYTVCGDSYEFNDGAHFTSLGLALDYCYCGDSQIRCEDGRRASLCNMRPLDGTTALVYDGDESSEGLPNGVEKCLGFPVCTLVTDHCSEGGWYLQCTTAGAQTMFVLATGGVTWSLVEAVVACNPTTDDGESKPGTCEPAVDDCNRLADCHASLACYDAYHIACERVVACDFHDNLFGCATDPACTWKLD